MITCRELIEFLDDYVGNEMSADRRQAVERHLAVCPDCVNYVDAYRKTLAIGRAAFADQDAPVPPTVPAGIIKAVLASKPAR
jgi:anti-sigma factor RsiW